MIVENSSPPISPLPLAEGSEKAACGSLWAVYDARFVKQLETGSDWGSTEASQPATPKTPFGLGEEDHVLGKESPRSLHRLEVVSPPPDANTGPKPYQLPDKAALKKSASCQEEPSLTFYSQRSMVAPAGSV